VVEQKINSLSAVAPQAVGECKKLIEQVSQTPLGKVGKITPRLIAARRASAEGKEGMNAFLNKRPPKWTKQ
jgi:methylglutaconyl-CoA hydratase